MRILKTGLSIFFLLASLVLPNFLKKLTCGFHLARFDVSHRVENWQEDRSKRSCSFVNPEADETVKQILSQPFSYLGRGAQCYAFEAQDGQFVIKIFHENREIFPFYAWKKQFRKKSPRPKHSLRGSDFEACTIAYEKAQEETALLYIHLLASDNKLPSLQARDPIGRPVKLPLDHCVFVLQKKLEPFRSSLIKASLDGNLSPYLSSFFSLIESRTAKGIRNADPRLEPNFGFLHERAIELDFGRYILDQNSLTSEFQVVEREKFIAELRKFMQLELPHEMKKFEETLAEFRARML